MKTTHYKIRSQVFLLGAVLTCIGGVYASEVTGTLSTGLGNNSVSGTVISAPSASPVTGTYVGTQSVVLTSNGSLSVRYTVDGTVPNCSTSTLYTTAISVASSVTLQTIACYINNVTSPVASYVYTITAPVVTSGGGGGGGSFTPSVTVVASTTATTSLTNIVTSTTVLNRSTNTVTTIQGKVLGATVYNFTKDLRFGSRGDDVTELQKILIAQGFLKSTPTGYFGALTRTSIIKWQVKNKLPGTGYFGTLSRGFINKATQ